MTFPEAPINPPWVDAPPEKEPPDLAWGEVLVHAIDNESEATVSILAEHAGFDGIDWPVCVADCTNDAHRTFCVYRVDDEDNEYATWFALCVYHTVDLLFCMAVADDEGLARALGGSGTPLGSTAHWYIQRWVESLGPDTRFLDGEG